MRKLFFLALAAITFAACGDGNDPVINPNSDNGMLSGKFTVSTNGDQVRFSQGNLQYNPKADQWRFATNQWDTVGIFNEKIAEDLDGWIDLFGWSTGKNPTKTSKDDKDYPAPFEDWGDNPIINGGNQTHQWRTLKADEWNYLIRKRTKADQRWGLGSVNGINGMILLPDDWQMPIDVPGFVPSAPKMKWDDTDNDYYDNYNDCFSHNTYNRNEWITMEKAGAVFLPAAGYREGTDVKTAALFSGNYWSATPTPTSSSVAVAAHSFNFGSQLFYPMGYFERHYGRSVRLVR